ncbi:MAG: NifU family protein [Alphaproteobacteria bacterium CG_4_10_14_0_8_um_filter_53_9]|nr:MAG: NifU family protein [Alphaproteobacteria bacterium CG_4_10_14_0_8_um_filter_53_9]
MQDDILTIRTERTPNPNSLKYQVGKLLIAGGSANFPTPESAEERSPLASKIFAITGVTGVFIGSDFFTVNRKEGTSWQEINEYLAPALEAFFESGDPVLTAKKPKEMPMVGDAGTDPALVAEIQRLLDEKVRPAVQNDGGDILYRGYEKGIVYLEMHGACTDCPSSTATLKIGVETMLKQHLPDKIHAVEAL